MILITGGAGFIGANFVLEWLSQPTREGIVNVDKLTYAGNVRNLDVVAADARHVFVHADMGDAHLMGQLLRQHRVRAIVNFAAESHVDRSIAGPRSFVDTNVVGTFELLQAALDYWKTLDIAEKSLFRFLHISTDEVFGTLEPEASAFTEKNAYAPNSPYSATKAASDHLVRAWYHTFGLPVLTTHCSNNYGPMHFPEKLIPLMIVRALSGENLPVYGDGLQIRDWLYVRDHCRAIMRVLESGKVGETYNIGGHNEWANIDIVKTICHILDELNPRADKQSYAQQITFVPDRPGHDRRYAIDASKIEKELGWKPTEAFTTGIRKTVQWYLENPQWVRDVQSGQYRQWVQNQYQARS